jgi:hypothetical protein
MVPFHALKQLHETVREQMPVPGNGVIGAMGEVFATKARQKTEPGYVLQPVFE